MNIASRFESSSALGQIHTTEITRNILGEHYVFEEKGEIEIKGKGKMKSFYLVGKKPKISEGI